MNITPRMSAAQYRRAVNGQAEDAKTVCRNRRSSDRGRGFERLLSKGCAYYADTGEAVITKTYEPYITTEVHDGGRFEGRWLDNADPDFQGTLAGGRSVVFEAKATDKNRLRQSALTDKQAELLRRHQDMGAIAFVAAEIAGRFFSIPFHVWQDMKGVYGKRFLVPEDIEDYEVIFDGRVRFLEYERGGYIGEEELK